MILVCMYVCMYVCNVCIHCHHSLIARHANRIITGSPARDQLNGKHMYVYIHLYS